MDSFEPNRRSWTRWAITRKAQVLGAAAGATLTVVMIGIGFLASLLGALEDDGNDSFSWLWEKMTLPATEFLRVCGLPGNDLGTSELVFQLGLIVGINAALLASLGTLAGWLLSRTSVGSPFGYVR